MSEDLKTEIKDRALEIRNLPTLPLALTEVSTLLDDPEVSTDEVARVIGRDQVLSAKVLKMVNSPVYGFPGRIGSVQHSLVLLGLNVIRGVIISTSVFDIMVESMAGLWEHSLGCATACQRLARRAGFKDPEEYSVAGLLHDLGKVVTACQMPDVKARIDEVVAADDLTYFEAERKLLGFGHDRINAWIAEHWKLPLRLKEGMAMHHKPQLAQYYPDVAAVVHIGDFLTRVYEFGSGGDDQAVPLKPEALKLLKLTMCDLEVVLDELEGDLSEIAGLRFA
jgi:putative nucleotidyltransferase with HDIG domain